MGKTERPNGVSVADFKYRGAGVLVNLHEREMRRFLESWRSAKASGASLPTVDDPDYACYEALLRHVLRWSRGYLRWVCGQLGLPDPGIRPIPDTVTIEAEAASCLEEILEAWRNPLKDIDKSMFRPEYVSPWGVRYCVEAMLEHAVMHPVRHRYQLEELI